MTSNLNIYSHIFSEDVKNVTVLHLSQFLFHDLQRDIQIVSMKIMSFISFLIVAKLTRFYAEAFFQKAVYQIYCKKVMREHGGNF